MKPNTCLKSAALILALACTCLAKTGHARGDALADSFLSVHELGAHLVDAFKLEQFRAAIERDANEAVIMDDRNDAKHILQDLGRRP